MNPQLNALGWGLGLAAALLLCAVTASAQEVCHYAGRTDHSGHVEVVTVTNPLPGHRLALQVALKVKASAYFQTIDYLVDEVSYWQTGQLRAVGINTRYLVNGGVQRQLWDVYNLSSSGFAGSRIQGKRISDIQNKNPNFIRFWDPRAFGAPWMDAYSQSNPERRPDLDLARTDMNPQIKTPLALSFYWVRFLRPQAQVQSVFLAGEKKDKRLDLFLQAPVADAAGAWRWQVPLKIGAVRTPRDTPAAITISPDQRFVKMELHIEHSLGSVQGTLLSTGCSN